MNYHPPCSPKRKNPTRNPDTVDKTRENGCGVGATVPPGSKFETLVASQTLLDMGCGGGSQLESEVVRSKDGNMDGWMGLIDGMGWDGVVNFLGRNFSSWGGHVV